jgi:hypothetical protein
VFQRLDLALCDGISDYCRTSRGAREGRCAPIDEKEWGHVIVAVYPTAVKLVNLLLTCRSDGLQDGEAGAISVLLTALVDD